MNFGQAIEALKEGKCVARKGWNGKNMHLYLKKGKFNGLLLGFKEGEQPNLGHGSTMDGVSLGLFNNISDSNCVMPCIFMKSASGNLVPGWLASQTDILSEDWQIVLN